MRITKWLVCVLFEKCMQESPHLKNETTVEKKTFAIKIGDLCKNKHERTMSNYYHYYGKKRSLL